MNRVPTFTCKDSEPEILEVGIPIIALPRLRVIIHLHFPLCRRVYESLPCLLPGAACLINAGMVSRALKEDSAHDQKAVDGQVYYQGDCHMRNKQDDRPDQAEYAIRDDEPT